MIGLVVGGHNVSNYASIAIDALGIAVQPSQAQIGLEHVEGYVLQVTCFVPKAELDIIPQAKRLLMPNSQISPEYVKGVFPFGAIVHAIVPRDRLPKVIQDGLADVDKQNTASEV